MQIVRTIVWVVLLVLLLGFSFFNWKPVEVQIWDNLILETKVPALVIVSFLLGLVPMWLIHRGSKWRLQRRIAGLETAARAHAAPLSPPPQPAEAAANEPLRPAPDNEVRG
jgi:lipopolysaccharide assembly protein A